MVVGRLAPTPSGHLHLGNVVAFAGAWLSVRQAAGRVLLRFEDVDAQRARPHVEAAIREDLRWLGLDWDEEVAPQRDRDYGPWLDVLRGLTYRCTCTRQVIRQSGGIYPGTCRYAGHTEGAVRLRLADAPVTVVDRRLGRTSVDPGLLGDPVLARRDGPFAYSLAVVCDDVADGVTEVARGSDLLEQTAVQIQLWRAFGATPPTWLHLPLILGPDGRKLSKSHGSTEVRAMRAAGWSPEHLWGLVLPWLGIQGIDHVHEAVSVFDPTAGEPGPIVMDPLEPRPTSR